MCMNWRCCVSNMESYLKLRLRGTLNEKMCFGARKVSVAPREMENSVNANHSPWFPNPFNRKYARRKTTVEVSMEFRIAVEAVAPIKTPSQI